MSKTKESAISTLSASEFFKRLDLSKLDPNTANYIRQEILSFQNINMLDGTPEFEAVREMVEENYPQALGIIPVPEKDIEDKKTQPKEITGKVNKKEQQRLEKEEKEAAKEKHKQEVEEIEGLIELMEDTVKDNPNDTDSKDYLELLQDTLKELKKKKFEEGGSIGEHHDEVVKLEYIGELIEKGNTSGYDPYWKLSIEFDGEIDDDDRSNISHLVKNGFTSGEIVSGEESKRGWWSIDIGESMAKGGGVGRNYEIELIENSSEKRRWKGTVSPSMFNKIKSVENSGGFKRFDIDLYDDESSSNADNSGLYEFMNSIGIKWTSTLPTVDKNKIERTNWENGGAVDGLSDNDYFQVVNHFVYFCLNYPQNFFDAFGHGKDDMIRKHIESKFNKAYDNHGSYGAMVYFWTDLDGKNKEKLAKWIKENFKGKPLNYDGDTTGIIDHFVYFTQNYPDNFMDAFDSNGKIIKKHIQSKFDSYYKTYGSWGVMIKFWVELDAENEKLFAKWIKKNYTGHSLKYENGGGVGNDVLPPAGKYSEYLQLASSKFGITVDQARSKYGQYTIGQWEELLGAGEESNDNTELQGKFVYKFHEERGELSAYVENMATGEEVWSFKYPDYSLPEDEREFQSTPVSDGFMRHWEDINGLENYLKDLSVLPDGSELMSEEKANNLGYYKDGGGLKKWYAKGGGIDNPTIKKIHNAILDKRPSNYSELIDVVNSLTLPSYGWNANNVYYMGAYQGVRLFVHDSKQKKYELPSKTEVYAIKEHEGLNRINSNKEGKEIKHDGGSISDHYEQVNDLFVDKKTFAVTTREDVKVHQGTSFEDALKWAKEQYEKKSGGAVAEATETFVIGDILQNKKHPHIYVTLITEKSVGGTGKLFNAYESDKKGKGVTEGNWVRSVWDWDFKDWDKVGHVNLKQVEKKSDDKTYSYYKSGNKQIDTYLSLFDDRYQFFVNNAPKPLKNLRDKLQDDNHHYATATLVSDFFNDPKKNKVTQYKFKKGGKIEKEFIEKVKSIHNQMKEVTLKDGTKIDAKDLMADGGALKNKERVEIVLKHYLIAALWSSTDSDNEDQPFDSEYDIEDFDKKSVDKARKLIVKFMMDNESDLKASGLNDEQIGHDLWLTQVGHGAGFWDRGLDKQLGDKLSSEAKKLGQSAMLFAQKGKVHIDGLNNPDEMAKGGKVVKLKKSEIFAFWRNKEKRNPSIYLDSISELKERALSRLTESAENHFKVFDNDKIYQYAEEYDEKYPIFSKGGGIWIKDALSGGKNKGALRRTAMRKGLLRNEKENLSKTDLHKLEKMGGKTAKRAYFAETVSKFAKGGSFTQSDEDKLTEELVDKIQYYPNGLPPKRHKYGLRWKGKVYSSNDMDSLIGEVVKFEKNAKENKFDTGGGVSNWEDLSAVVPSAIKMEEKNAGQGNAELILTSNGKTIAKFWYNIKGYNPDFSMKNKDGVYYELGSDRPKATMFSNFKKGLREGYTLVKH